MTRVKAFDYHPVFNKTVLKNGVKVVTEHHPFTRSVSAGIFVDTGTRDEPATLGGAAHFMEHMVFKGTRKRSAFEIAKSLEEVGGDLNAYTSREYTCYHASCLREHLPMAMDVLTDLVSRAEFSQGDFEVERDVVIHEIDMSADDLEEYIFDLCFEKAYRGHSLGRPILGTRDSLQSMTRKSVEKFYHDQYTGKNLTVSVAGNVDHEEVVDIVERNLGQASKRTAPRRRERPRVKTFRHFVPRPSEQVHVLFGFPSGSFADRLRFESYIVSAVLGGGMTSKLYQAVRERRGLAYSVYSYLVSFTDSGLLTFYAASAPKNVERMLALMIKEVINLRDQGIRPRDLKHFLRQVKGQILLGADDVENRMNSLAINDMVFGEYRQVDDVIRQLDDITVDSVQAYLDKYIQEKSMGILLLGDLDHPQAEKLLSAPV